MLFQAARPERWINPKCACWFTLLVFFATSLVAQLGYAQPLIKVPDVGLSAKDIAVVYLKDDPQSLAIASYYQTLRNIPQNNVVAVEFDPEQPNVDPGVFAVQQKVLNLTLPAHTQAYALAWTKPFRVGCMGMTAAFTLGYNVAYCSDGCYKTRRSPYHHTTSVRPFDDFGIRPAMMLAGTDFEGVKELIHRGLAADNQQYDYRGDKAKALLLSTADKNRSVRQVFFPAFKKEFSDRLSVNVAKANAIYEQDNILFYFTGSKNVDGLDTLGFLPGAIADHLTSHGGSLVGSSQMSALKWLEAGATASYGTAREPCNFLEKFPDPTLVARYYLRGYTAVEAYWKSVAMPGQGNFIGDPLAKPYSGYRLRREEKSWVLNSPVFYPGYYNVFSGFLFDEQLVKTILLKRGENEITLAPPFAQSYRIERKRL